MIKCSGRASQPHIDRVTSNVMEQEAITKAKEGLSQVGVKSCREFWQWQPLYSLLYLESKNYRNFDFAAYQDNVERCYF